MTDTKDQKKLHCSFCGKNLEKTTKFPPIRQIITPDGFVMD